VNYRFRGEKTVDALEEWAATSLLKLPRILYYGAKGLVTHNTHYLSNSFVGWSSTRLPMLPLSWICSTPLYTCVKFRLVRFSNPHFRECTQQLFAECFWKGIMALPWWTQIMNPSWLLDHLLGEIHVDDKCHLENRSSQGVVLNFNPFWFTYFSTLSSIYSSTDAWKVTRAEGTRIINKEGKWRQEEARTCLHQ
jgi:hypothetical protein